MSFRGPPDISGTHSLLVLNISFRTRAEDLRKEFSRFGDLADIYIPRSRGESRGYAFVRYYNKNDADEARKEMDKMMLDNREIGVQVAKYGRQAQQQANRRRPRSPFGRSRSPPFRGRDGADDRYGRDRRSPRRNHSPRRFDNDGAMDSRRRSRGRSPDKRDRSPDRRQRSPDRKRSRQDEINGSSTAPYEHAVHDSKRGFPDNSASEREHRIEDDRNDDRNGRPDRESRHDRDRNSRRDRDYDSRADLNLGSPAREARREEGFNARQGQRAPTPERDSKREHVFEQTDSRREREYHELETNRSHERKPDRDTKKEDRKLSPTRDAPSGDHENQEDRDLKQPKDLKYDENYHRRDDNRNDDGLGDAPSHVVDQPWTASPANARGEDGGHRRKYSR